jgi:hypothetical protein
MADPTLIKLSDLLADPNTTLTSIDTGDIILVWDYSETIDTRKIKVITQSNLMKLVTETARQAVVSSQAAGDIFYASSATALARLAKGNKGNALVTNGSGVPAWNTNYGIMAIAVRASTDQTIPASTWTDIVYDTENHDHDGMFDMGSPSIFTIQTDGMYLYGIQMELYVSDPGSYSFNQLKIKGDREYTETRKNTVIQYIGKIGFDYLTAGNTIKASIFQDSSVSATVYANTCWMWAIKFT